MWERSSGNESLNCSAGQMFFLATDSCHFCRSRLWVSGLASPFHDEGCPWTLVRSPLLEKQLDENPDFLSELAGFADIARTPAKALQVLGLRYHPSAARINGYRDPLHMKIIYHADPLTIFQAAPSFSDIDGPPAPPLPPVPPRPMLPDASDASLPGAAQNASGSASSSSSQPPVPGGSNSGSGQVAVASASSVAEDFDIVPAEASDHPEYSGQMEDLFRSYVVRRISSIIDELEANGGKHSRTIFSVKLTPGAIQSLCLSASVGGLAENQGISKHPAVDVSALSVNGWLFLQLVRRRPGSIVTPIAGVLATRQSDWGIGVLRVHKVLRREKQVHVSTAPVSLRSLLGSETAQVILSLHSLSIPALLGIHFWQLSPALVYDLPGVDTSPEVTQVTRSALAQDLLAQGSFHLQGNDELFEGKSSLLTEMRKKGLIETCEKGGFCLTSQGRASVSVANVVSQATQLQLVRDIPYADMEVAELLLSLYKAGWRYQSVERKHLPCQSYVAGESEKVWFHELGKDSLIKEYFILLLTAETHAQAVPHLKAASIYKGMLGLPSSGAARVTRGSITYMEDDDLFVDTSVLQPSKKRRTAARRKKAVAALDNHGQEPEEMMPPLEDEAAAMSDQEDADARDQDEREAQAVRDALEQLEPEVVAEAESSGSSSNSSSSSSQSESDSSSSSSSSSSDSQEEGAGPSRASAAAKPKSKPKPKAAHHTRSSDASTAWGVCRLTRTKDGWQMTCTNPAHQTTTAACTKTRSNRISGENETLRLLKTWALLGP